MRFTKLFIILFTSLVAQRDGIVNGNTLTFRSPLPNAVKDAEGHPGGMPPCVKQPDYDPLPWGLKPDEDLNIDIQALKYPGWIPSCCSKKYFICVFVKPGVTLTPWKPGAGRLLYRFELEDGTHVDLFWYWQGTIQYTAEGGTVDFYPAHGNNYICVKGGMLARTIQKGKTMRNIRGIPGSSEEFNCGCEWAANRTLSSDDDLILYPK